MAVTYDLMKRTTRDLYEWSLKKIPEDSKVALRQAIETETDMAPRQALGFMLKSAEKAEAEDTLLCSDSGVPTYSVKIGTGVTFDGDIKQAIVDGFADLVETIEPPILKFVTNPLTGERRYHGKDMPIVAWDVISGVDHVDITCAPTALGAGRWAALEVFSYPTLDQIEGWIMDMVVRAGSQACPPVTIGIGIGGSFDVAARLAKQQTLRPFGTTNPEPILADMEARLLQAVNKTGFGPMGTGGQTTALGVHIDYASGHGYTPVAIAFNCWINRRTRALIHNSGKVERLE